MSGPAVLVVETLTGRITDTLTARDGVTSADWSDTLNAAGSISQVSIPESVMRDLQLRERSQGMRCSLAVERDGRIRQAGPITSRGWNWEQGKATYGAQGIWAWLDRRVIRPPTLASPPQSSVFTVTGKSLGGIARALVQRASTPTYCTVPIVLPPDEAGNHTESFPLWKLLYHGEQLRQITQRATDAPDIAFRPRRRGDDPRYMEWVMQVGTAAVPALSQPGGDWVFDTTAPKSPVLGISTDEDPSQMAEQRWGTGQGQEEAIPMAYSTDYTLLNLGWPLTEGDGSYSTVSEQATLQGNTDADRVRYARPVEVFKVSVQADAAREVASGDYCRLITKAPRRLPDGSWTPGDAWLGDMNRRMRVKTVSGNLTDTVVLEMYPMAALS